ncbi:alpha/beta hydrolase [Paracrocinitomix mangrovi]|uniref:alpha/beta hydrolase family protein n=1 Tax=Paracrocinitomix mangrovi TaxID=2862509 RepID=UPI001C8CF607|nr:alpha/beta hydrolase [Paracrocinitomix mangrovi]UKN02214.1 alpha/beta hydrolase [Paracrocinitomix mangrovi]
MIDFTNKIYEGSEGRLSLFDCEIPENAKAVILFIHGYKGYKDWGAWNLMQKSFVDNGFGFVKFNLSHNGGTVDEPIDFPDLDAFGHNTYSKELYDIKVMVNETYRMIHQELELDIPLYLLGHSRGGGDAVLYASTDNRVAKVVSLAGISDIASRFPKGDELLDWEREGVRYVLNGRTHQEMPHFYEFYTDFIAHQSELDIQKAAENLKVPFLQIHGDMDEAVSISEGLSLANWTDTRVHIIKGGGHTFGMQQPWEKDSLPDEMYEVIQAALEFFNS